MKKNNRRLSLLAQNIALKTMFPESAVRRFRDYSIEWLHDLTPGPLSDTYKVKLLFNDNDHLTFFVLAPKLVLAQGAIQLPHVYDNEKQQLCLFYPDGKEWDPSQLYTKTIIPWACEWLLHYEYWVGSNDHWKGGGKHPQRTDTKIESPDHNALAA